MTVLTIVILVVAYTFYDTVVLKRFDIFLTEAEIPSSTRILSDFILQLKTYVQ